MPFFLSLLDRPAAIRTLNEARALLNEQTPLRSDCGRVCGHACCQPDETGENGMLLFPFEDSFYQKPIEGFPYHLLPDDTLFKGGKRLVCEGACPREHRPLACRLFPLRIRLLTDDIGEQCTVRAEADPRAWVCCPLLERGGLHAMSPAFIDAVQKAGERLIQNVYMLEALHNEQDVINEMRRL